MLMDELLDVTLTELPDELESEAPVVELVLVQQKSFWQSMTL